ncbi:MAG TPA: winged helix-turn-helix domain-containing protein [Cellulomonas sp.]
MTRTSSLTAPSVLRPVAPTARTDEEVSRQIRDFERLLAALPVGPAVVIDVPGRRLVVNGSEVPLTLQEFDLVVYLARSAGRVVTREELYRAAWHRQTLSPVTRTVDVHVRRVRAKSGLESLITTVRGVGYRLNAIEDLHLVD